jgi:metallo-beta-lactamase class B
MSARFALAAAASLVAGCATAPASAPLTDAGPGQRGWAAACADNDEWDKPGPPFRITGNTYYVGTCGITSLLIVSPAGHALIDSGTDAGARVVLANIAKLGFDPKDVKVLLMTHEHFDHVGGMARLQAATGATIVSTPEAAKVLRRGLPGADDPQARSGHPSFTPISGPIVELQGEDSQLVGDTELRPMRTPGHTPGALSWTWRDCGDGPCMNIVYADSLNPISSDGYRFSDHPELVRAFRAGIVKVAAAPCDIVLAPHPGSGAMRSRLLGEKPLVDQGGCRAYAATVSGRLDKRLMDERAGG